MLGTPQELRLRAVIGSFRRIIGACRTFARYYTVKARMAWINITRVRVRGGDTGAY
jgi:hypothetical protein